MSLIHFLLAHTMYKLLGFIQAMQTILRSTQKGHVLGEKQKESIWPLLEFINDHCLLNQPFDIIQYLELEGFDFGYLPLDYFDQATN